jgi:hypothetical protein
MKRLFRKGCVSFFDLLCSLHNWLEDVVFKLDKFIIKQGWKASGKNSNTVGEKLAIAFKSTKTFEDEFNKYMDAVLQIKPEYETHRTLLYYNFSLRYFVAYYESRFDAIPLQVYNEYRMAFDHFMRSFIVDKSDKGDDWDKALNHMLRGILDILKLNCFWLREFILHQHKSIPRKALDFISNGEYIKIYSEFQVSAEFALWEAKRKESEIGSDSKKNLEVVKDFINAFLAHMRWDEYQRENKGNIVGMVAKYRINIAFKFIGVAAILKVIYDKFGHIIRDLGSKFIN